MNPLKKIASWFRKKPCERCVAYLLEVAALEKRVSNGQAELGLHILAIADTGKRLEQSLRDRDAERDRHDQKVEVLCKRVAFLEHSNNELSVALTLATDPPPEPPGPDDHGSILAWCPSCNQGVVLTEMKPVCPRCRVRYKGFEDNTVSFLEPVGGGKK